MVNKAILIGNVGKDPLVKATPNSKVANLTLATSETYTDRNTGQKQTNTDWHNIVVWGGLADVVEKYVKKGTQIFVEGKMRTRSYDDQTTGQKKYVTEVVAEQLRLLGGRSSEGAQQPPFTEQPQTSAAPASAATAPKQQPQQTPPATAPVAAAPVAEDDLPF